VVHQTVKIPGASPEAFEPTHHGQHHDTEPFGPPEPTGPEACGYAELIPVAAGVSACRDFTSVPVAATSKPKPVDRLTVYDKLRGIGLKRMKSFLSHPAARFSSHFRVCSCFSWAIRLHRFD
jgi:hypothetical protein